MTSIAASSLRVGQSLQIAFPSFTPRITFDSARELTVEILAGENAGFSDIVEYVAIAIRDDVVMLSWQERIGSTVVHVLDLVARQAHTCVTPAKGGFMRLSGPITIDRT